jgi:aryl-phospho-beta-D-glucosidase BglC (GH1 family)
VASPASGQVQDSIDRVAATLATTVNVSELDDSPDEASWGCCELQEEWFDAVADAGFTAVRLAVKFSGH